MKLIPYDINKFKNLNYYTKGKVHRLLLEFAESGLDCVKVEDYPHKNAYNCTSALQGAIKHYGFNTIRAMTRDGEVFLIRKI